MPGFPPTNCPTLVLLAHFFCRSLASRSGLMPKLSTLSPLVTVFVPVRLSITTATFGGGPVFGLGRPESDDDHFWPLRNRTQYGTQRLWSSRMRFWRTSRAISPAARALASAGLELEP